MQNQKYIIILQKFIIFQKMECNFIFYFKEKSYSHDHKYSHQLITSVTKFHVTIKQKSSFGVWFRALVR